MRALNRTPPNKLRPVSWWWFSERFLAYLEMVSEAEVVKNIQLFQGLMSRKRICRKSGTMGGRISKHVVYGGAQMPKTQFKIGRIREESGDFARRKKMVRNSRGRNIAGR